MSTRRGGLLLAGRRETAALPAAKSLLIRMVEWVGMAVAHSLGRTRPRSIAAPPTWRAMSPKILLQQSWLSAVRFNSPTASELRNLFQCSSILLAPAAFRKPP